MPTDARQVERYDLPVPETDRGRRTRAALVAAAEEVFGDLGYDRASITAITQTANVAQGTFYKYFPSKHAIFVELVIDFAVRVREALSAAADRPPADRAALERRGFEALFEFALAHPGLNAVLREAQFVAPATYRWYYESFVAAYAKNFDELSGSPRLPVDLETLGWAMAGVADTMVLRWVVWERRLPPEHVLDTLVALLAGGFEGMGLGSVV